MYGGALRPSTRREGQRYPGDPTCDRKVRWHERWTSGSPQICTLAEAWARAQSIANCSTASNPKAQEAPGCYPSAMRIRCCPSPIADLNGYLGSVSFAFTLYFRSARLSPSIDGDDD